MTKTVVEKSQAEALIREFFKQYTLCCNRINPPTAADFVRCLSPYCHFSSNGQNVAKSLSEYLNHIVKYQRIYSRVELSPPKEILTSDNKIAVRYDCTLTPRKGNPLVICLSVIATVDEDQIVHWEQIAHQKGAHHWEK